MLGRVSRTCRRGARSSCMSSPASPRLARPNGGCTSHFRRERVRGEWFRGDGEVRALAGAIASSSGSSPRQNSRSHLPFATAQLRSYLRPKPSEVARYSFDRRASRLLFLLVSPLCEHVPANAGLSNNFDGGVGFKSFTNGGQHCFVSFFLGPWLDCRPALVIRASQAPADQLQGFAHFGIL